MRWLPSCFPVALPDRVSIRPTKRWLGVAHAAAPRFPRSDVDRLDFEMPLPTWPARLRRYLEIDAMIYLAGPIAVPIRIVDAVSACDGRGRDEQARRTCTARRFFAMCLGLMQQPTRPPGTSVSTG